MALTFEKAHFTVSGRVQGVGFRYATQRKANELGLGGWVRNTSDGRVEVWAEGEAAQVEALIGWCRQGPATARVENVEMIHRVIAEACAPGPFEIRR